MMSQIRARIEAMAKAGITRRRKESINSSKLKRAHKKWFTSPKCRIKRIKSPKSRKTKLLSIKLRCRNQ